MATVAQIQRAGLYERQESGYIQHLVDQEHDALAKARCYPFWRSWHVEESESDIEGTYTSVEPYTSMGFYANVPGVGEHIWISSSEAFNKATMRDTERSFWGDEDMSLVEIIDRYNDAKADEWHLPKTYAECEAGGDTTSGWALYLKAREMKEEEK